MSVAREARGPQFCCRGNRVYDNACHTLEMGWDNVTGVGSGMVLYRSLPNLSSVYWKSCTVCKVHVYAAVGCPGSPSLPPLSQVCVIYEARSAVNLPPPGSLQFITSSFITHQTVKDNLPAESEQMQPFFLTFPTAFLLFCSSHDRCSFDHVSDDVESHIYHSHLVTVELT